jgi:hypothetical protein
LVCDGGGHGQQSKTRHERCHENQKVKLHAAGQGVVQKQAKEKWWEDGDV